MFWHFPYILSVVYTNAIHSDTSPVKFLYQSFASYQTDGSEKSLLGGNKKTNRFLQKVKYTMQKKKVTMPFEKHGLYTISIGYILIRTSPSH